MAGLAPGTRSRWIFGAFVVVTELAGGRASAQGTGHDQAVAAFEEARRFIDAGDCASAIVRLGQSLELEPSVGANLSMADCQETTDPLQAWTKLREAERLAYLKHDERRAIACQRAAALETKLPLLRIELPAATLTQQEVEIRVDGLRVDPYFYGDAVFAVTAGTHVVTVSVPHRSGSKRVLARAGATTPVTVDLETECAPGAPAPPVVAQRTVSPSSALPDPGSARRSVAYVVGGVGVAALGAGEIFGIVSATKRADIASACGGDAAACRAAPGVLDGEQAEQRSFARLSDLGFVVAGAAIAGAVVLYVTAPHGPELRLEAVPVVGSSGSGLLLSGRW